MVPGPGQNVLKGVTHSKKESSFAAERHPEIIVHANQFMIALKLMLWRLSHKGSNKSELPGVREPNQITRRVMKPSEVFKSERNTILYFYGAFKRIPRRIDSLPELLPQRFDTGLDRSEVDRNVLAGLREAVDEVCASWKVLGMPEYPGPGDMIVLPGSDFVGGVLTLKFIDGADRNVISTEHFNVLWFTDSTFSESSVPLK